MEPRRNIQPDQDPTSAEYSTLPLALLLSTVILLSAAGGWFFLNMSSSEPADAEPGAANLATLPGAVTSDTVPIDFDLELRKARLAANADILAFPAKNSALYFYGRVVAANPDHSVASAEFDAVLARISTIINVHLAAGEIDDAHRLAAVVAEQRPDHPLVDNTRLALNDYAARLVSEANQHAQDGNDDDAAVALNLAEQVPGLNAEYIAAVRESISEIQQARIDAEVKKLEEERLATEQAVSEWIALVRGAIQAGSLVAPAGGSALDYLAYRDTPEDTKEKLTQELFTALTGQIQQNLETGDLETAEFLLGATGNLDGNTDELAVLRDSLDGELIAAEGRKVLGLSDFVPIKTDPAVYPIRAARLDITGWVEVEFTVTSNGGTADIKVIKAEPESMFERSAVRAVEQWQFVPRQYRGQIIDQRAAARLVFNLE